MTTTQPTSQVTGQPTLPTLPIIPALPTYGTPATPPAPAPASAKQVSYILSLAAERDMATATNPAYLDVAITLAKTSPELLAKHVASTTIDALMHLPKLTSKSVQKPASKVGLDDGYYTFNRKTIKVVRSPQTGNLYAKELTAEGWVYVSGLVYKMKNPAKYGACDKLTLETAKEYGKLYGVCCICARTLTDETSITNGLGPICQSKYF